MPVVINEFEAVAETPAQQRDAGKESGKEAQSSRQPTKLEPAMLRPVLFGMNARALRVWSH